MSRDRSITREENCMADDAAAQTGDSAAGGSTGETAEAVTTEGSTAETALTEEDPQATQPAEPIAQEPVTGETPTAEEVGATGPAAPETAPEDDGKDARIAELEARVSELQDAVAGAPTAEDVAAKNATIAELTERAEKAEEAARSIAVVAAVQEGALAASLYKSAGQGRPGLPVYFVTTQGPIQQVGLSFEAWRGAGSPETLTVTATSGA
jgi:hypothetical protein